eukprot:1194473-Prorocentrum_minimum.AAC.3
MFTLAAVKSLKVCIKAIPERLRLTGGKIPVNMRFHMLKQALAGSDVMDNLGEMSNTACYILAEYVVVTKVEAGEIVFAKGDEDTCMGIVLDGTAAARLEGKDSK